MNPCACKDGQRPTSPGSGAERPRLLLRGLDSLYVSYYLDLAKGRVDFDDLEYRKQRLHEVRHGDFAELALRTERLALMPFGKKPYRYILSNAAFEVRLGEKIHPSCHVQFKSQFVFGHKGA